MTTPSHIGQYRILRKIGAGGMGLVFLGEHTLLGRRAAIKTLLPTVAANHEIVERFFNEARATSAIVDPGVIQIFDFGYHVDGTAYIVMELLEGEALSARLERFGKLGLGEALRFARQIAGSLVAAHARDIIHRDLKPENIFLVRDAEAQGGERTKIIDFGVCKVGSGDPALTEVGTMIGTPVYMSPEQCRGGAVDQRSDIYAFGCLLFHLLTGRPPFLGEASGDLIVAHLQTEPPPASRYVPELPPEVDALLRRCLEKSPDDRFASMTELLPVLAELAELCDIVALDVVVAPATVPLGQGFRSVYDANLAARLGRSAYGSAYGAAHTAPMSQAVRPRLRFASTPPTTPPPAEADDGVDAPPRRAGVRAALACVLVVGVTLGLVVTPLVLGDDDDRHTAADLPATAALSIEGTPATESTAPAPAAEPAPAVPAALLANTGHAERPGASGILGTAAAAAASDGVLTAVAGEPRSSRGSREASHRAITATRRDRTSPASSDTASEIRTSQPVTSPAELDSSRRAPPTRDDAAPTRPVISPAELPSTSAGASASTSASTSASASAGASAGASASRAAESPVAPPAPAKSPEPPARTAPPPAAAPSPPTEDLYDTR